MRAPGRGTPRRRPAGKRLRRETGEGGFSLIEAMVALTILALVITFVAGDLVTSAFATQQSQAREVAAGIGAKAVQEAESLGADAVGEGIECATVSGGYCTALAQSDPNGHLSYDSANGCWYYGAPSAGLVVPTAAETSTSDTPIIPYATQAGTSYPPQTVNGVTYNVAAYPMYALASYSGYTCPVGDITDVPDLPVTVVVQVTWHTTSPQLQTLSMDTTLYQLPQPVTNPGNCPPPTPQAGSHDESLLATPNPTSGPVSPGQQLSVFFLDEAPTPTNPSICVIDSSGYTEQVPWSQVASPPVYYGTSAANPYLPACTPAGGGTPDAANCPSGTIWAVHPAFGASGPNAASPPTGGTYCSTWSSDPGNCNTEEQYVFTVPDLAPSGEAITSLTIAAYDHEGDLDYFTWSV